MSLNSSGLIMTCMLAVILGPSEAKAQPVVPEVKTGDRIVCSSNGMQGPASVEKACLARLNGDAVREGSVLRITLRNGTTKAFKDAPISCHQTDDPNDCIFYTLIGYHPENDSVIVQRWLDGGPLLSPVAAYMMELASGRVLELPDVPHYSPDGSRFVSMRVCDSNCANRIDIWSIQDRSAKLEWRRRIKQQEPKTFFYKFLRWQGNEQVKFSIIPEIVIESEGKGLDEDRAIDAKLTRAEQGWIVDPSVAK